MTDFDFEEVEATAPAKSLDDVGVLVTKMMEMIDEIDSIEMLLKKRKEELRIIQVHDLVETMDAANCSEFKFKDGRKVGIKDEYNASIPKDREYEAYEWLRENGHGSLIKRELKLVFGRNEDEEAEEVKTDILDLHPDLAIADKAAVHASTLKAFVKEQSEKGNELPKDLLGIYQERKAVLLKK